MIMPADAAWPVPKPGILDIAPYVPGRGSQEGSRIHKLSSNESALGASPKAVAAFNTASASLAFYPDGSATQLRGAIAARYGLNPDRIVCGSGSDELLQLLAHAYLDRGDEAIYSQHGFLVYPIVVMANGARGIAAPEHGLTASVDEILRRVTERTRLVFLANPNNPTGTYLSFSEVKRLHAGLPKQVLLILDAAYAEFVRRNDYESGIELVSTFANVVMTRTFSKIYGLAGLRLGWAYCPEPVADALNRVRGPFNVSAPALAAGAAALSDGAFVERALAHNEQWLPWLASALEGLGLKVTPSVCNFLLVHFPADPARNAASADKFLTARGLLLRRMEAYGLPGSLRLTVGIEDANRALVAALKDFLA